MSTLPACRRRRASDAFIDSSEPQCACWELNSGPPEEQTVYKLLAAELSPSPSPYSFWTLVFLSLDDFAWCWALLSQASAGSSCLLAVHLKFRLLLVSVWGSTLGTTRCGDWRTTFLESVSSFHLSMGSRGLNSGSQACMTSAFTCRAVCSYVRPYQRNAFGDTHSSMSVYSLHNEVTLYFSSCWTSFNP